MNNVGLMIGRVNPLSNGHTKTILEMISNCKTAIFGLGSCQDFGTHRNPLSPDIREKCLRNVFGDRLKIIKLYDINSKSKIEWTDYVFNVILENNLPKPELYFAGSDADGQWFDNTLEVKIVDRYTNGISATDIRSYIESYNEKWKNLTPSINHALIDHNYPKELRVTI